MTTLLGAPFNKDTQEFSRCMQAISGVFMLAPAIGGEASKVFYPIPSDTSTTGIEVSTPRRRPFAAGGFAMRRSETGDNGRRHGPSRFTNGSPHGELEESTSHVTSAPLKSTSSTSNEYEAAKDWSKSLQDVATSGLQHIGQRIAEVLTEKTESSEEQGQAEIPYKALWPCGTLCFFAYLFWAIRVANILHGYHLLYEELSSPLVAAAVAYWLLMPLVMVTLGFMSTPEGGAPVIAYCVWFGFWACHMAAAFTSGKLTAKGAMMTRCSKALGKGEKLFYATLEHLDMASDCLFVGLTAAYGDRVTDQWVHSWQDLRFGNLVVPVIEAYGFSGVALVLFVTTAYLPQLLVSPSFMAPVLCLTFLAITWVWTQLGGLFGLVLLAGLFALLEWSGGAEMWWEGFVTGFALANDKWLLLWLGLEAFTKVQKLDRQEHQLFVVMTKVVFENGPQLWLQSAFLAMTWGQAQRQELKHLSQWPYPYACRCRS